MLKGLASQLGQENDLLLVDGVRNNLFGPPGAGGLDLAALDIQRGRDHGLPDYNTLRKTYGLERVTSFDQISSDPATQAKLQQLFGTVDNIDAFVGALAEDHLPGSGVGPLVHAVVGNQFERLRDGDRFFYTADPFLQSNAVRQILDLDKVTLARVIKWNTDITHIQADVFFDHAAVVVESAAPDFFKPFTAPGGPAGSVVERADVPHPDGVVVPDGHQPPAVGAERQAAGRQGVPAEDEHLAAVGQVPHPDDIPLGRGEVSAARA
jgi:hypothetical protein